VTTTTAAPPQQFSGTGDFVQPIALPGDLGIATIAHTGTSNFSVTALDSSLNPQGLLVNVIGNYSGTVLVPANTTNLQITADGPWTIDVKPTTAARPFDGKSVAGHGDDVVSYPGATGVAAITHVGQSNFVVSSYKQGSTSPDLLVNVIGNYTGSVPFPGPALVTVSADGDWTITVG
jgi:hypothetical protein